MRQEKIVKKIYAIVMSIVMMFTMVPVNFVVATTTFGLTLNADKTEVNAGDEVNVTVDVLADSNIVDAQFAVNYDTTKVEIVYDEDEDDMYENSLMTTKKWMTDYYINETEGFVNVVGTGKGGKSKITNAGNIVSLKFKVKSVASGKIDFSITPKKFDIADSEDAPIEVTAEIANKTNVFVKVPLQKIEVNKSTLELNVGESSDKLIVSYDPDNTTDDKTVTWTTSDATIATVTDGVVTASTKPGTATITAKVGTKSVNVTVTVKSPLKGIDLNKSELSLEKGKSEKLNVTVNPTNTTDNPVFVWTSSNESVAKVDNVGMVTAVGKGTATITVKTSDNKFSKTCTVGVTVPVESITLSETSVTLEKGVTGKDTKVITATVNPVDATDEVDVAWVSNDTNKVTVEKINSTSAKVTAVGNGEAEITATLSGKQAKTKVTVATPIKSIALNKTSEEVTAGQTDTLTVTYNPEDTTIAKAVTWTTSDATIATVANGTVKALKPGNVTITATLTADSSIKATCEYTVNPVPMTGIQLDKKSVELNKGANTTLVAKVLPQNTTDSQEIKWKSSNTSVATVDSTGKVTAVGKGTATITATSVANSSLKDECAVTVVVPITGISIDKTTVTLEKGVSGKDTVSLVANKLPADTTDTSSVTWTSSDEKVATVDNTGKVTAVGKGTAKITAKIGTFTKECNVTVVVPLESITINEQNVDVYLKASSNLTVKINPTDASVEGKTVTWTSSDEKVVTVDKDGKVTAISEGKATITAKLDGKEATTVVNAKRLPLNSIAIKNGVSSMKKGETVSLGIVAEPEKTTDEYTITWTSSDEKIATVDENGKVTALKAGKVTITATSSISEVKPVTQDIEVTEVAIESVKVDYSNVSKDKLVAGKGFKLSYKVGPEDTTEEYDVIWVSSDETIAKIDNQGNVTPLKEGKVKFTVQAISKDGSKTVTDTYEVYINAAKKVETVKSPETGDMNVSLVILAMAACGLVMVAILRRKKANVK